MKTLNVCFLFFVVTSLSFAQSVEDVVIKVQKKFADSNHVEYSMKYQLFKGHNSSTVHSAYNGYCYKSGKEVYQKINNTEFVYGKGFFLQLNHDEQAAMLGDEQKVINSNIDLKDALDLCSEKVIENKSNYYIINLTYKIGSNSPFTKMVLKIDKESYNLLQLDMFYVMNQDFSDNFREQDLAQPHLRIIFSGYSFNPKNKKSLFEFSNYLSKQNNTIQLVDKYSSYELIDIRNK